MADLELFVVVDQTGDFAVGQTAEEARNKYEEDVGALADAEGFRTIKINLTVPLPEIIEAEATVAEDKPAKLAVA